MDKVLVVGNQGVEVPEEIEQLDFVFGGQETSYLLPRGKMVLALAYAVSTASH